MRFEFKREVGERIQRLVDDLKKEGLLVFNEGHEIQTSEEAMDTFGERTPTILRKFSAKIEFLIPDDMIEVVK